MYVSALLSTLHILGVILGFIALRGRIAALKETAAGKTDRLTDVFNADNLWGLSAIVLLSSGLVRAFLGYEKGSAFYLNNTAFYIKLGLFLLVFALEILPMATLIGWRIARAKNRTIAADTIARKSATMRTISLVQAALLLLLLVIAPVMARGMWMRH